MSSDKKIRVGILRGGGEQNFTSSLNKSKDIIVCINEKLADKYNIVDILVDKDYVWHCNGLPINPSDLVNKVEVVWNTSHSSFSNVLDSLSISNVNNGSFLETLENNSAILQTHMKNIGIAMPRSIVFPVYQKDFDGKEDQYAIKKAREVFEKFSGPWIVKSFTEDKTMGIHLAKTYEDLVNAIGDGVAHKKSILVEEFIEGKIASIHSLPNFRGQNFYTFPLGNSYGNFSTAEKEKLTNLAEEIHNHLGAKYYLKSDFILNPRGKVYLLSVSGAPDLKPNSHFSQVCKSVGAEMHHIIEHILNTVSKDYN